MYPESKVERKMLESDLIYFGLNANVTNSAFSHSKILDESTQKTINEFYGSTAYWSLLYRAESPRENIQKGFRSKCFNKGPILIVMKSQNEVFGGYTEQSLSGQGTYLSDPNAWIFCIADGKGYKFTRSGNGNEIVNGTMPQFGQGPDLSVPSSIGQSVSSRLYSFSCRTGFNSPYNSIFGASQSTVLTALEVFELAE